MRDDNAGGGSGFGFALDGLRRVGFWSESDFCSAGFLGAGFFEFVKVDDFGLGLRSGEGLGTFEVLGIWIVLDIESLGFVEEVFHFHGGKTERIDSVCFFIVFNEDWLAYNLFDSK